MPIYEYQCEACGNGFETLQKMSEEPLRDCPACNQPALRKKVSAAGFRLKGGGWYETDFKSGKQRNVVEPAKENGGDKTKNKESAGDSKPKPAEKAQPAVTG